LFPRFFMGAITGRLGGVGEKETKGKRERHTGSSSKNEWRERLAILT